MFRNENESRMIIIKRILSILLSGVIAIIALSLFAMVYSYAGIHLTNGSGATDYVWRTNEYKATMTEGFAWERMDDNGFHNVSSNLEKIDILLMGSSHMEAVQMRAVETTAGIMNSSLEGIYTYNIGMSGHDIYRCITNVEDAINEYKPTKYVVIETATVCPDVEEMEKVINGSAVPIPSYDSGLIYKLQHIPAFRPLYKQIEDWGKSSRFVMTVFAAEDDALSNKSYRVSLECFLNPVAEAAKKAGIKPVIMYHPSETLQPDGTLAFDTEKDSLDLFREVCNELDISFIDMTDSFERLFFEKHRMAYGFCNTKVGAGHLNKYGHQVIAEELMNLFLEGVD